MVPSAHLRSLRARVPDIRLFAPRVALAVTTDIGSIITDPSGELPTSDLELGSDAWATSQRLLVDRDLPADLPLRLHAVHTGPAWFESHPEVGALQPIWVVVAAMLPQGTKHRLLGRPPHELPLVHPTQSASEPRHTVSTGGAYIQSIRERIGHDRIFYPWAGAVVRTDHRLLLVRDGSTRNWHCPGGGMEIGETPPETISRELDEETGLSVSAGPLLGCWTDRHLTYPNGDKAQVLSLLLRSTVVGGKEADDRTGEIDKRGWFLPGALPPLQAPWDRRVHLAWGSGEPTLT